MRSIFLNGKTVSQPTHEVGTASVRASCRLRMNTYLTSRLNNPRILPSFYMLEM